MGGVGDFLSGVGQSLVGSNPMLGDFMSMQKGESPGFAGGMIDPSNIATGGKSIDDLRSLMFGVLGPTLFPGMKQSAPQGATPQAAPDPVAAPLDPQISMDQSREALAPDVQNSANGGEDIVVTGDGWKPRKQTVLGAIADAYLMSQGKGPMFANARTQRNVNEAMEGFASDPDKAMRRLSRVPGYTDKAWNMYNQHADNKRADLQAQSIAEQRKDAGRNRVAAMIGTIQDDASYQRSLPTLRRLLESRGVDPSELPDTWDPDIARLLRAGGMTVDQQEDNSRDADYDTQRLNQYQQTIDNTQDYRGRRLEQMGASIEERRQTNDERIAIARERLKNGGKGMGELIYSPDGTKAKRTIGGKTYYFSKGANGRHYFDPKAPGNKGLSWPPR